MGLGSHRGPLGPMSLPQSCGPEQRQDPWVCGQQNGERLLCPDGCGPKRASPPAHTGRGWPQFWPLPGDAGSGPAPGSSRFSVSHFEILNTISSLPVLLRGSPLHRGDSLPSWDKVPAGTWHPRGALPAPHRAGHNAHPLGSSRLGFETSAPFPTHSKGQGWDMGHGHAASKQPMAHSPTQPPSNGALPGDGESFTPVSPSRGWWEPLGTTTVMAGTHQGGSVLRGARPPSPSCPSCAVGCRCPLRSPQSQLLLFPSLNPPALSPILLVSPSPIAASLN